MSEPVERSTLPEGEALPRKREPRPLSWKQRWPDLELEQILAWMEG